MNNYIFYHLNANICPWVSKCCVLELMLYPWTCTLNAIIKYIAYKPYIPYMYLAAEIPSIQCPWSFTFSLIKLLKHVKFLPLEISLRVRGFQISWANSMIHEWPGTLSLHGDGCGSGERHDAARSALFA